MPDFFPGIGSQDSVSNSVASTQQTASSWLGSGASWMVGLGVAAMLTGAVLMAPPVAAALAPEVFGTAGAAAVSTVQLGGAAMAGTGLVGATAGEIAQSATASAPAASSQSADLGAPMIAP